MHPHVRGETFFQSNPTWISFHLIRLVDRGHRRLLVTIIQNSVKIFDRVVIHIKHIVYLTTNVHYSITVHVSPIHNNCVSIARMYKRSNLNYNPFKNTYNVLDGCHWQPSGPATRWGWLGVFSNIMLLLKNKEKTSNITWS